MAPKDHRTGNLSPEFALLGFLIDGPSHGYDLHQRFVVELGQVWHLSQSQAYAILKRLEQHGDISAQVIEQDKLPARQRLRITAQGRKRFFDWMDEISLNARSIRLEFLTRLYFAQIYKPDRVSAIHAAQFNAVTASLERLEHLLEQVPSDQPFNCLSLELRLQQMQLIKNWMAEIRTRFHIPRS